MKKVATIAAVPLFAAFMWAQTEQTTRTETTTTKDYAGTLVDANCYKTHTENKQTTSDANKTTTRTETTERTECPVTTETTTFGLVTPEGQYVRFDEPSNTRVIEVIKNKKEWKREIEGKEPIKVRVVGMPNGDLVVVRSIQ
jgi:hypothetical protein